MRHVPGGVGTRRLSLWLSTASRNAPAGRAGARCSHCHGGPSGCRSHSTGDTCRRLLWRMGPGTRPERSVPPFLCGPTVADRCDRAALRTRPDHDSGLFFAFQCANGVVDFGENDPRKLGNPFGTPGAVPQGGEPLHHRARSGAPREFRVRSPQSVPGKQRSRSLPEAAPQRSKDDGKVLFTTLRSPPTPWSYRRRMLGRSRVSRRGGPNGHAARPLQKSKGSTRPCDALPARRVAWRGAATWG